MKLLRNRKIAVSITAIVVILTTLFGVGRSLNALARDIEAMFYDGVYIAADRFTQPGIDAQLRWCASAALGLATITINYPELESHSEEVMRLRRELLAAESIGEKSRAFRFLAPEVYSLAQAALDADLTARDLEAVAHYQRQFADAEAFIRNTSLYNQTVSQRWDERSFIARFIGSFVPVREPEMF